MQFQVPQFIDIEDKVIGPLTIKQFLYFLAAGVAIFIIYKLLNLFATIVLAIPIISLAVALAFVKIGNQPFISFLKSFLGFVRKPDFYVWKKPIGKEQQPTQNEDIEIIGKASNSRSEQAKIKPVAKDNLQDMSWRVEVDKE